MFSKNGFSMCHLVIYNTMLFHLCIVQAVSNRKFQCDDVQQRRRGVLLRYTGEEHRKIKCGKIKKLIKATKRNDEIGEVEQRIIFARIRNTET